MNDVIKTLRRRIGDEIGPFVFTDEILTGYVEDAVSQVELDLPRGFSVDLGVFNIEPTKPDCILFAIKAHYLIKLRTKDKADRDNFLLRKGSLTLDNTKQSSDHKETLDLIASEYKKTLFQVKNSGLSIKGVRME
jgi:hypothetical protein